jgi:hypothetical protein
MTETERRAREWLGRLAGEWTYEFEGDAEPGGATVKDRGSERARSLGGLWMLCEAKGEPTEGGSAATDSVLTLGFDSARQRFVGTFVGSMSDYLWIYEGELDAAGRVLTLATEGPSFTGDGSMGQYRDTIELDAHGARVMTSSFRRSDDTYQTFMRMRYQRVAGR